MLSWRKAELDQAPFVASFGPERLLTHTQAPHQAQAVSLLQPGHEPSRQPQALTAAARAHLWVSPSVCRAQRAPGQATNAHLQAMRVKNRFNFLF